MLPIYVSLTLQRVDIHNNRWCMKSIVNVSYRNIINGSHTVQPDETVVLMTITHPECLLCVCNPTIAHGLKVVKTIEAPNYVPTKQPVEGQEPIYGVRVIPYDTLCMLL